MEYEQVLFPTQATPPLAPHDSLDDEPSWLFNLEVMDLSTDNHREVMPLSASSLPSLEHVNLSNVNLEST